jgi:hypothetical protein
MRLIIKRIVESSWSWNMRVYEMHHRAKLRKKVVKNNGFWKINAIRPEIKAKEGRTGKFYLGQKANWGESVKELGCQIVTRSYSANCYILHSDGCQKK